jgi:hypothetical protein
MAITYKGGNRLVGLSSDTKPTADGKHINGSTFIETDTGKEYILNYGAWTEKNKSSGGVAELLDDYSQIRPKRFWYWFSGSALTTDYVWTTSNIAGTPSFAMVDTIDEGFGITTATNSGDMGGISFGNKRHFNYEDSVCIGVVKKVATSTKIWCGFKNSGLVDSENWTSLYGDGQDGTYKSLTTGDGAGTSTANSSVANDTAWTLFKIETASANNKLSINGVLRISKTDDLNDAQKTQPIFQVKASASGGKEGRIRYIEAYNTT